MSFKELTMTKSSSSHDLGTGTGSVSGGSCSPGMAAALGAALLACLLLGPGADAFSIGGGLAAGYIRPSGSSSRVATHRPERPRISAGARLGARGLRGNILEEDAEGVQPVLERSRRWVDEFIVGLNICPFAKKPVVDKTVRYVVSDVVDCKALIQDAWREAAKLLDSDPDELVTTLLMAPKLADGVDEFSSMGNWMEDYLEDEDEPIFQGDLTIAVFHPEWTFDGYGDEDPVHFEKRSPYPTVSLLRRQELGAKVKEYMDKGICLSEKIQVDNAKSLQGAGFEKLKKLLAP